MTTALSGLNAAETRLGVSANNIANATTPGYQAQTVRQTPVEGGGVRADVVNLSPTARALQNPDPVDAAAEEPVAASNVSVENELIETQLASYNFQANLKVLKTQNEMDKSLLDIQA